jgi:hypothetical protein
MALITLAVVLSSVLLLLGALLLQQNGALAVVRGVSLYTWRNIFAVIGTAAGFAISLALLQRVIGSSSPWLGLLVMFYFLALTKVAQPLFMFRMPATIRSVRPWELEGTVYNRLLVLSFGKLLRETPLRYLNSDVYLDHRQTNLPKVSRQAEAAEAAHFWAALLFTPYIGYVWLGGHPREALVFLLVQITFNIYPIMHLRIVRGRLDHLLHQQTLRLTGLHGVKG